MTTTSAQRIISVLTSPQGIILLVALVASGLTGRYQRSVTEVAKVDLNPDGSSSAPDEATRARITETFGKLPLRFEANKGQSDEKVKFLSHGSGYTLCLTSTEAVLSLSRPEETSNKSLATDRGDQKKEGERAAVMSSG